MAFEYSVFSETGWTANFTPEYPTEIHTNVTDKLRKNIKSPLDRLEF
ncbi:MAG: hypothetical protein IPI42_11680 [Saprospiraceae bacterium]|nr:hypothetical protein [Candidatus Parvibacillus calidus]